MSWRDAVALAGRALWRRLGRSALTVIAVALAAALLTGLLIIATTARTRVLGQLSKGGPLASIRVQRQGLGDQDLRRLARVAEARSVAPISVSRQLILPPSPAVFDAKSTATQAVASVEVGSFVDGVVGIDMRRANLFPITLLAGRLPAPASRTEVAVTEGYLRHVGVDQKSPVLVLGTQLELAEARFLGQAFEDGVFTRWTRATIVGVVAQEAGSGDVLAPVELIRASRGFSGESATYAAVLVEASSLDAVGRVHDAIETLGYSASAPENLIATVQRYLHVVQIVLSAIGLIALVIAAIGITNALLAAVRERRQELGVLKAIGARDRDVLRIFLVEAAMVGLLGGLIGVTIGWGIARTVTVVVNRYMVEQGLAGVRMGFPWVILIGGLVASTLLALVAGAFPAVRAARLPAREAMGSA